MAGNSNLTNSGIKLPGFALEGNESIDLVLGQINNCFISYKNEYDLVPDILVFCGKYGTIIGKMLEPMLKTMFQIEFKEKGPEKVIFRNASKPKMKQVVEKGVKRGESLSGKMVNGFCAPNMGDLVPFAYTEEKTIETRMDFDIIIL